MLGVRTELLALGGAGRRAVTLVGLVEGLWMMEEG